MTRFARRRVVADGLATSAFIAATTSAAAATITWMLTESRAGGTPPLIGTAGGAVAGLVAIAPASGVRDTARGEHASVLRRAGSGNGEGGHAGRDPTGGAAVEASRRCEVSATG